MKKLQIALVALSLTFVSTAASAQDGRVLDQIKKADKSLSVQDYFAISVLDEVFETLILVCNQQLQYYGRQEYLTGVGEFQNYPPTSFFVPQVLPIFIGNVQPWVGYGILQEGQKVWFQYSVEASGTGSSAEFVAKAIGNRNGDNTDAVFTLQSERDTETGRLRCSEIKAENPLE